MRPLMQPALTEPPLSLTRQAPNAQGASRPHHAPAGPPAGAPRGRHRESGTTEHRGPARPTEPPRTPDDLVRDTQPRPASCAATREDHDAQAEDRDVYARDRDVY